MLRWLQTPTVALLEALLAGQIALTHHGLDSAHERGVADQAVAFVRAALVAHGVLPERDEPSAAFARWQQTAIIAVRDGPDRAHLRAYASWQVAHQLARTDRRFPAGRAAQKYARSLVTEAIKLTSWLHEQGLELRGLHQDLLESWITAGASARSPPGWNAATSPARWRSPTRRARPAPLRSPTTAAGRSCEDCCTTTRSSCATGAPDRSSCSTPSP